MLAEQLGMGSIEELEAALDAMEGIADDGGELTDNFAREARVRSAYIGWCKDFGKESDETRFQVFMSNFLAMEEYANESGKMMTLNKFADYTEEEYITATTTVTTPVIEEEAAAPTIQELKDAAAQEEALVDPRSHRHRQRRPQEMDPSALRRRPRRWLRLRPRHAR